MSYSSEVPATQPKQLELYLTRKGDVPFTEWLDTLRDVKARAKIRVSLDRLQLGNPGDSKSVGGGVSELRINFGPGYRVYFGQDGTKLVILLCGGDKSTQQEDIKRAQQYWTDYKKRTAYGATSETNEKLSRHSH